MQKMEQGISIHITGIVQGVGFRPFVYNLALKHKLRGFCLNDSEGVQIEVYGAGTQKFIEELRACPPPLAKIESFTIEQTRSDREYRDFTIRDSRSIEGKYVLISPDIAICHDCRNELFNNHDRRFRYPFINCTNCGPRYSIIKDIPYDRPKTTMASFRLCADCEKEYHDPCNRRFHAQPNACETCGPSVWIAQRDSTEPAFQEKNYPAILKAQGLLKEGAILAVKGIGGFHLACDASNHEAVKRLREKKRKSYLREIGSSNKPFAIMSTDLQSVRKYAKVSEIEKRLLEGRVRPIVLLEKSFPNPISPAVAPNNRRFGVMLPYTPLHYLLLDGELASFTALVMTSGNLAEEPITIANEKAVEKLGLIADYFLLHDRDIYMRVDDSIVSVDGENQRVLRRARGYVPGSIELGEELPETLACGGELKNTFCLIKGSHAILSTHIGDLENYEALEFFKETLENMKNSFRSEPVIVAHDIHPDYLSTKFAAEYALMYNIPNRQVIPVQHHHAHIVSVMAEHGLRKDVIGVSFDGTGYGTDGKIWGGEFITADRGSFTREAHLDYLPMPGGEKAIREPWRMAISHLYSAYGDPALRVITDFHKRLNPNDAELILKMIKGQINSPLTSSAGRVFDAVASMIGIRDTITFEGEAAIELESIADSHMDVIYPFVVIKKKPDRIDLRPMIRAIVNDYVSGEEVSRISGRFHLSMATMIVSVVKSISEKTGLLDVALSGGVFQNRLLLSLTGKGLAKDGFTVWVNEKVPANDGGISLGQAVAAIEKWKLSSRG